MAFNRWGDNTVQTGRRIIFNQFLMHGMAHDVAQVLPGTGRHFQQPFFLDAFQQADEMTGVQLRNRQVPDDRKDMVVHAGKQTGGMVLRPCPVALVPVQRYVPE